MPALRHTDLTPRVGSLVETDLLALLSGGHADEIEQWELENGITPASSAGTT